jgi:alkanesulfonate monooxygenase SsuD/methylene tetrahydromethanopterin reductase-like flavin-dependent oxidoreductase (luciferase family)
VTRVSITAPQFASGPGPLLEAAAFVESSGLDGLFLFDHLVPLGEPGRPVLELAAALGLVAAATSRATVGTLVLRVPMRGPGISTAIATTAHRVAGGRLVVGMGAGDSRSGEEAVRFGQTRPGLGERLEMVAAAVESTRAAGITTWVGGSHPRVVTLARRADGWNGWGVDPDVFAAIGEPLRREGVELTWGGAVLVGRDRSDLDAVLSVRGGSGPVIRGTPAEVAASLRALIGAGAGHLVVSVLPNVAERWELFAAEVVPRLR